MPRKPGKRSGGEHTSSTPKVDPSSASAEPFADVLDAPSPGMDKASIKTKLRQGGHAFLEKMATPAEPVQDKAQVHTDTRFDIGLRGMTSHASSVSGESFAGADVITQRVHSQLPSNQVTNLSIPWPSKREQETVTPPSAAEEPEEAEGNPPEGKTSKEETSKEKPSRGKPDSKELGQRRPGPGIDPDRRSGPIPMPAPPRPELTPGYVPVHTHNPDEFALGGRTPSEVRGADSQPELPGRRPMLALGPGKRPDPEATEVRSEPWVMPPGPGDAPTQRHNFPWVTGSETMSLPAQPGRSNTGQQSQGTENRERTRGVMERARLAFRPGGGRILPQHIEEALQPQPQSNAFSHPLLPPDRGHLRAKNVDTANLFRDSA